LGVDDNGRAGAGAAGAGAAGAAEGRFTVGVAFFVGCIGESVVVISSAIKSVISLRLTREIKSLPLTVGAKQSISDLSAKRNMRLLITCSPLSIKETRCHCIPDGCPTVSLTNGSIAFVMP
jgi:hypothetical protein